MNQYLALLRNTDWDQGMSVEEVSQLVEKYTVWMDRMVAAGKIAGGMPLVASGRNIAKEAGGISDGPFIESKEAIGGYILINAADYSEAAEIMKSFPPVGLGVRVELRQLTDVCPVSQRLQARLEASRHPAAV